MGLRRGPQSAIPDAAARPRHAHADARRSLRPRRRAAISTTTSKRRASPIIRSTRRRPTSSPSWCWRRFAQHKLEKRIILQSFDLRTLVAMRKLAPEIRLSALTEKDKRDFAAIAKDAANAEIVSPEFHLVTPEKVAAAHAAGVQVVPWTADAPADWDKLIAAKVDAIITDDPAELIAYLKKRSLR